MNWRWLLKQAALLLAVLVIVSPVILFFVWMLSLSVKYEIDNAAYPPILIPERFAWKNYVDVLESNRFSTYFVNSLLVTGTATLLALVVGVPAGYGIARMKAAKAAVVILVAASRRACPTSSRSSCCSSGSGCSARCGRRSSSTSS